MRQFFRVKILEFARKNKNYFPIDQLLAINKAPLLLVHCACILDEALTNNPQHSGGKKQWRS